MCLKTSQIVIGLFITLYLTRFCCCYIIPQNQGDLSKDLVLLTKGGERTVQICGATLTNFLQILCRGNFNKMGAGGSANDEKKLTDYCCRQSCKISVLAQFCEEPPVFLSTPGFVTRSSRQLPNDIQNHPSKLIRASASKKGKNDLGSSKSKGAGSKTGENANLQVSVNKKKNKNKKRNLTKRKRKTNNRLAKKKGKKVKMQCTYKSFGHYLLKRDPEVKVRYHSRKRKRNNTVMPLQVDTIPPNFESLGAMPEIVP